MKAYLRIGGMIGLIAVAVGTTVAAGGPPAASDPIDPALVAKVRDSLGVLKAPAYSAVNTTMALALTRGGVTVTGTSSWSRQNQLEHVSLVIEDDPEALHELHLAPDATSRVLLPTGLTTGQTAVALVGTQHGFALIRDGINRVNGEGAGLFELPLGFAMLSDSSVEFGGQTFEAVVTVEQEDGVILMLFDSGGLAGVRVAARQGSAGLEEYYQSSLRFLAQQGFATVADVGTRGPQLVFCCITCGGPGQCCCYGRRCTRTDREARCWNGGLEVCRCNGSDCSCGPEEH